MIRIVAVRQGEGAKAEEIGDDLEAFQSFVGGYIEAVGLGGNISIICNEDGMSLKLPNNGCGILGPYFFLKASEDGESVSLSDQEVLTCFAYYSKYRDKQHQADIRSFDTLQEMINHLISQST